MKKIFAQPLNLHDHNTYDGEYHIQYERYDDSSRRKHCYWKLKYGASVEQQRRWYKDLDNKVINEQIPFQNMYNNLWDSHVDSDEIFATNITVNGVKLYGRDAYFHKLGNDFAKETDEYVPEHLWDHLTKDNVYYADHHQCHAAHTFLSSGYEESDIFIIDGQGNTFRAIFIPSDTQEIINLSNDLPVGWLWNVMTRLGGFGVLNEGKLMGLAGFGKYSPRLEDIFYLMFEEFKVKDGKYWPEEKFFDPYTNDAMWKEDMAFTLQKFTNEIVLDTILPHKTSNNLCVAGGVSYNGYLNEKYTKHWENVFVPNAPGDEGQSMGLYMHCNYVLNGRKDIPEPFAGKVHEVTEDIFK